MELRQIEYFVAVVDRGGFTRAAAALHVSQPALSQGIAALERDLGMPVFHRLGRSVSLTATGEAILPSARQLLRDATSVRDTAAAVAGLRAGHLDVVALPTLAVEPLAVLIGEFRRRYPAVTVRLAGPEDAGAVLDMVRTARCELALCDEPVPHDLVAAVVFDQQVHAVCPPGTRVARRVLPVSRLAEFPLVTTPLGTSTRRLIDAACASAGITPRVAVEAAQREAILPLVLAGAGITFLPAPLARLAAEQGAVVARLDPPLHRTIRLVHRRDALSPAATEFVALASERLGGDGRQAKRAATPSGSSRPRTTAAHG